MIIDLRGSMVLNYSTGNLGWVLGGIVSLGQPRQVEALEEAHTTRRCPDPEQAQPMPTFPPGLRAPYCAAAAARYPAAPLHAPLPGSPAGGGGTFLGRNLPASARVSPAPPTALHRAARSGCQRLLPGAGTGFRAAPPTWVGRGPHVTARRARDGAGVSGAARPWHPRSRRRGWATAAGSSARARRRWKRWRSCSSGRRRACWGWWGRPARSSCSTCTRDTSRWERVPAAGVGAALGHASPPGAGWLRGS